MPDNPNSPKIIRLGYTNCYAWRGSQGFLLVDGGSVANKATVLAALRDAWVAPSDISLVVITHAHVDHALGLRAIVDASGAPVLCHKLEASSLEQGRTTVPPGTNWKTKIISVTGRIVNPLLRFDSVSPTILVDEPFSLAELGFAARVLPTPGHSTGSITVIAEENHAFVGDLCIGGTDENPNSFIPLFADNIDDLLCSWRKLLDTDINMIYPSHGRPFAAHQLRTSLLAARR